MVVCSWKKNNLKLHFLFFETKKRSTVDFKVVGIVVGFVVNLGGVGDGVGFGLKLNCFFEF